MNINIVAGRCSEENNKYIFDCIKNRDKSKKHIIVAPDRCLFSLEQRLFDETQEQCFFDVNIISLSRLSRQVLATNPVKKKILTKQSGVALTKYLLVENKDKLSAFKKSCDYIGFATSLFETICLYKSCNISPQDVYVSDSDNLYNLKQKDIKLIYQLYEEFLQRDYTDSFNQLYLFADMIDSNTFKDTIFYFVEFDDFTAIMLYILSKIARFSDGIYINCTYGKGNKNSNIYSNKVYYDLIDIFNNEGLQYNITNPRTIASSGKDVLINELLGYNTVKYNGEHNIAINSFENISDEIKYTLADIYSRAMLEKIDFSQFAIVVPSIMLYKQKLSEELLNYNIPVYFDESKLLLDNGIIRLLIDICNILNEISKVELMNVIKSPILNFNKDSVVNIDNLYNKLGVNSYQLLDYKYTEDQDIKNFFTFINELRENVANNNSWEYYLDNIVNRVYEYIICRSEYYYSTLDSIKQRVFAQVQKKLATLNDDCKGVFHNNCTNFTEFMETYITYFESATLSLPPITSNTLFVADFETSYISNIKYLYILGCNEGKLPSYKLDNGLVTDDEIARLPNAKKINPTISMLNQRKLFKLFELVFKPERLILSYVLSNNEGKLYPNNLIGSLTSIMGIEHNNGSAVLNFVDKSNNKLQIDNLVFNNLTKKIATKNILKLIKDWEVYEKNVNYRYLLSSLYLVNKTDYLDNLIENRNSNDIRDKIKTVSLIRNNITSVSQIENFYSCPYKHFVNYGLRLQQSVSEKLQANDIGTIIHEVLKDIVPFVLNNQDIDKIINFSNATLKKVLEREQYIVLASNPSNLYVIKSLYRELTRIVHGIIKQISAGTFVPKFFEFRFDNMNICQSVNIKGSIDRVDISDNQFIIIDYKTGDNKFDDYNDVLSGKKLQLLVYAKAFAEKTGKIPVGAFYMPISNSFGSDGVNYQYNGVMEKSDNVITHIDMGLSGSSYKSNVINLKTTSTGKIGDNNFYKYMCLERNDFDFLLDFAKEQVETAIVRILGGDISPNPLKESQKCACDYCGYKGLCCYMGTNDNIVKSVSNIDELKKVIGGEDGGI